MRMIIVFPLSFLPFSTVLYTCRNMALNPDSHKMYYDDSYKSALPNFFMSHAGWPTDKHTLTKILFKNANDHTINL